MQPNQGVPQLGRPPEQRLSELLMSVALATDLGTGQPFGHVLRSCYLSVAIAREIGCRPDETRTIFQVALLRFIGCTADSSDTATLAGGNDQAFMAAMAPAVMGSRREVMRQFVRSVGAGEPALRRAGLLAHGLSDPGAAARSLSAHCEVASMLARRMHLDDAVIDALAHGYERWDGGGFPSGLQKDAIPLAIRIAAVARDADLFIRMGEDPAEHLRRRSGRAYDPTVVQAFLHVGPEAVEAFDQDDDWHAVLNAEPEPVVNISQRALDDTLEVFADFVDLKSAWMRGHSLAVASLAEAAAATAGLSSSERQMLRRAGLVHDLGRVGIENGIWDKPGTLTTEEWERVRLCPYYTQRILERCSVLRSLVEPAVCHHERLDRSGYHRGYGADQLSISARILAVADAYVAMTSDRLHRPALSRTEAAALLEADASAGRLDRHAVASVLSATGEPRSAARRSLPAGLTEREAEVLSLIACGKTNRDVAATLNISPKTVGRHVENIYLKIDVSTRAGAALFAMQHHLLA